MIKMQYAQYGISADESVAELMAIEKVPGKMRSDIRPSQTLSSRVSLLFEIRHSKFGVRHSVETNFRTFHIVMDSTKLCHKVTRHKDSQRIPSPYCIV